MKTITVVLKSPIGKTLNFTTVEDSEGHYNSRLTLESLSNAMKDSKEYFIKEYFDKKKSKWNPSTDRNVIAVIPKNSVNYIIGDYEKVT